MINIVYFGTGTYSPITRAAKYNVVLPSQNGRTYTFPSVYNFSRGGTDRILIHMQVSGVSPDPDLSGENTINPVFAQHTFSLNNLPGPGVFSNNLSEIEVVVYHDDEFILSEAVTKFWKDDLVLCKKEKEELGAKSITIPKRSGFGTLRPF